MKELSNEQKAYDLAVAYATSISVVREGLSENTFYDEYKIAYEQFMKLVNEA